MAQIVADELGLAFSQVLAISVYEAIRDAVATARGDGARVQLTALATAENVLKALKA